MGLVAKIFGSKREPTLRKFDLLTAAVAPGATVTTSTKLPWKSPRFKSVAIAEAVAHSFERIDDLRLDKGDPSTLTMSFQNTSDRPARLAAVVTIETDELEAQAELDWAASWPKLVDD